MTGISCITKDQWAEAGEFAFEYYMAEYGLPISPEDVADARDSAVYIATGAAPASCNSIEAHSD